MKPAPDLKRLLSMRPRSGFSATLLLLASVAPLLSQEVHPVNHASDPITLNVVVTPGRHDDQLVAGLQQANFTVLDNGVAQPLQSFRQVSGQAEPVKVLLVIDTVNAPYTRVAYEREQIEKFLTDHGGKLAQPTALAIFSDSGTKIQTGYSTDGNALSRELDQQVIGLRSIHRSAGFYGAAERLALSLNAMQDLLARARAIPGRKFIVWVSPGWPLFGGPDLQLTNKEEQRIFSQVVAFSDALRHANTTVYTVDPIGAEENVGRTSYYQQYVKGLKKPTQAEPADLGIQVLSEQSGGVYYSGNNDINALLARSFADAATQYQIQYKPPVSDAPNEYHRIEVKLTDPGLTARTLHGYYSQPDTAVTQP